ncbi:MAG: type II secretion system protein [Actinobacteria bacterium]|nr:type II secretion system protein [Actinomycetota bacterium]
MLSRFHRSEKGFTLIELLVVILIIGILVAIAVPVFAASRKSAQKRACQANLRTLDGATETFNADNAIYPTGMGQLLNYNGTKYLKAEPKCPVPATGIPPSYKYLTDKTWECPNKASYPDHTYP